MLRNVYRLMAQVPRGKIRRWSWRCNSGLTIIVATALILYNCVTIFWLLQYPPCTQLSNAENDDPIAKLDLNFGRWDGSRSYKLFDYAAVGGMYAEVSENRYVCLATQCSIEMLHKLFQIAAHWSGPISVAVYVAGDELNLLRAFAIWMLRCRPEIYKRMALHIAIPREKPGIQGNPPNWAYDCDVKPLPPKDLQQETVIWRTNHLYPQNHLRNLARKNCHSPYVYLIDVDIVPSKGMSESLDKFLESAPKCSLCAYVVPTYELDNSVLSFPADKSELLRLSEDKLAIPFHENVFKYNQYASNFSRWEANGDNETSETHVSHNVTNFALFYEPFYVAPDTVPPHDERFLGYGFTRNTQVYEMFLMGYQFQVLSPIFTIHWGLQSLQLRPLWRIEQIEKNRKHFQTFLSELIVRYRIDLFPYLKRLRQQNAPYQTVSNRALTKHRHRQYRVDPIINNTYF